MIPSQLGQLSPWGAHLCLRVEAFLRSQAGEFPPGSPLVLALSGGLDSTALLLILRLLAKRLDITLAAVHLDHGLRPESSLDAQAVQALCEATGTPCRVQASNVAALAREWSTGIEDAGRRARYALLQEERTALGAFAVVTAHQLDELAEDALMRLTRGAGWPALGGMRAFDPARAVVRPLLLTPKGHLRRLLEECGVSWREDPSNTDPAFLRNRVRAEILPLFVRENPDFLNTVAELWRQARTDENHWETELLAITSGLEAQGFKYFLPNTLLLGASPALRLRLYKRFVEQLGPGQPLADGLHGLDAAWREGRPGRRFQFPGGKEALVEPDGISFRAATLDPRVDSCQSER